MNRHINYTRPVSTRLIWSLDAFMTREAASSGFAAFCGNEAQRRAVAVRGILHAAGERGIVYIHGSNADAQTLLHDIHAQAPRLNICRINGTGYDPLYGMDVSTVVDTIASLSGSAPMSMGDASLRTDLLSYLEIMEVLARRNPRGFGTYPFNLNTLVALTSMSYDELERNVASSLPRTLWNDISASLMLDGAIHAVRGMVRSFAMHFRDALWTQEAPAGHTRQSIISIASGSDGHAPGLISIEIPSYNTNIMDAFDNELQVLLRRHQPFLLIADGVRLAGSRLLARFTNEHDNTMYTTGILASDANNLLGEQRDSMGMLLANHSAVIIFQAANVAVAQPFCACFGSYYRIVKEKHRDYHWHPFRMIPDFGGGKHRREIQQEAIRPEELTGLRQGAVLISDTEQMPVIVRNFRI